MRVNSVTATMGRVLPHKISYTKSTSENSSFPRGEFDELKKNFRAVQEENFKLQAVITDVTEVNKRWQKYNNDRQMYVQRLLSTIQDQQEQMNKVVQDKVNPLLKENDKSEISKPSVEVLALENCRLQEEVSRLHRRLEGLEQDHREHVEVLEFQVKAHRDDWEAERSEKQQALQDKEQAERKVRELQKELRALKLKFRDEKLHGCGQFHCCGTHTMEPEQCNIFMPGSQVNICRKAHPKTYRTSVHLPSTSGHLLSRGTTLFFGDDLAVDGDQLKELPAAQVTELPDDSSKPESRLEDNLPCPGQLMNNIQEVKSSSELNLNQNSCSDPKCASESNEDTKLMVDKLVFLPGRSKVVNERIETLNELFSEAVCRQFESKHRVVEANNDLSSSSSSPKVSCSVLQINPSASGSSVDPEDLSQVDNGENLAAGGVSIGFNRGLASVMSFSHAPIVKSASLPVPEEKRNKVDCNKKGLHPLVSRWSLDSNWSINSIASPPISQNFAASADSLMEEIISSKVTSAGSLASGQGTTSKTSTSSSHRTSSSKANYFDEGVATQTREDVICPGCGQVFPPKLHLKFLDHFEKCQSNERDQKRNSGTVKSRN